MNHHNFSRWFCTHTSAKYWEAERCWLGAGVCQPAQFSEAPLCGTAAPTRSPRYTLHNISPTDEKRFDLLILVQYLSRTEQSKAGPGAPSSLGVHITAAQTQTMRPTITCLILADFIPILGLELAIYDARNETKPEFQFASLKNGDAYRCSK